MLKAIAINCTLKADAPEASSGLFDETDGLPSHGKVIAVAIVGNEDAAHRAGLLKASPYPG